MASRRRRRRKTGAAGLVMTLVGALLVIALIAVGYIMLNRSEWAKYPVLYADEIKSAAGENGVPAPLVAAVIMAESSYDPQAVSSVGAMGLMQIMPATAAFLATQEGIDWTSADQVLYDPISNIRLGCRYMSELVGTFNHDGALAAYNGGPKRAALWLASNRNDSTLFKETRSYVPAVNKLYDQFRSEGMM